MYGPDSPGRSLPGPSSGLTASELDLLSPPSGSTSRLSKIGTDAVTHDAEPLALDTHAPRTGRFDIGRRLPRVRAVVKRTVQYIRGPSPPLDLRLTPLLDRTYTFRSYSITLPVESACLRATRRFTSLLVLILFGIAYIISLSFLVRAQWYTIPADDFTGCTATFWLAKDGCGLDGESCTPFNASEPIDFRCPASCASTQLLNIRTVGDEQVIYQPLVVGGGDDLQTFRGDSWVCAAAIQTGAISNSKGGCASVQLTGNFTSFIGTIAHGISSISFPSTFPLSYRIIPSSSLSHCSDLRSPALAFNILITAVVFLVLRPKPLVLYWVMVCIGFWHITFFSDPRSEPPPISDAFGVFLPTLFVAHVFWMHAFRHVIPAFNVAPVERAVWYLPPFWCGALFNVVTARVPVDRLLASDLQRPGAIIVVIVVGIFLLVIVVNQIRVIRKTGWLPSYLASYITGALVIMVLSLLPTLTLRVHHYFVAIVLMAGTAFPTRLSAVYQAFLLGMFLDGASRWGFDSILQTAAELLRDAPLGTSLPEFLTNTTHPLSNLTSTLTWMSIDAANTTSEGWNGFSLLVDDVERYAGTALYFSLAALQLTAGVPHYFRLAYQRDGVSGDFTNAAVFFPNGTFTDPAPGPS